MKYKLEKESKRKKFEDGITGTEYRGFRVINTKMSYRPAHFNDNFSRRGCGPSKYFVIYLANGITKFEDYCIRETANQCCHAIDEAICRGVLLDGGKKA